MLSLRENCQLSFEEVGITDFLSWLLVTTWNIQTLCNKLQHSGIFSSHADNTIKIIHQGGWIQWIILMYTWSRGFTNTLLVIDHSPWLSKETKRWLTYHWRICRSAQPRRSRLACRITQQKDRFRSNTTLQTQKFWKHAMQARCVSTYILTNTFLTRRKLGGKV